MLVSPETVQFIFVYFEFWIPELDAVLLRQCFSTGEVTEPFSSQPRTFIHVHYPL